MKCPHCNQVNKYVYIPSVAVNAVADVMFTVRLKPLKVWPWETDAKLFDLLNKKKTLQDIKMYVKTADELPCGFCGKLVSIRELTTA